MNSNVTALKNWFNKLSDDDKKDVITFLYGNEGLMLDGVYCGPKPGIATEGLYLGPPPQSSSDSCPRCGKPW